MKQKKTVLIIGGGVAGLAAGIYAQKNGLQATICERHALSGGLCSYWMRKGYTIDNCVHWLTGTNPTTDIYQVWRDTGVLGDDVPIYRSDFFMQVEHNGKTLHLWRDKDKLRKEMLRVSPEDQDAIEEFVHLVDIYKDTVLIARKPTEQLHWWEYPRLIWKMRKIGKHHRIYSKMSIPDFAARFKSPLIREFLLAYFPEFYNTSSLLFVFAAFCSDNADLPAGGSKGLIERMVKRFQDLGGTLLCNYEATQLEIHDQRVEAVTFKNGETLLADYVIGACDMYHLYTHLLPENCWDEYMTEHFRSNAARYPSYGSFNAYFAVDHTTTTMPDGAIALEARDLTINNKPIPYILVKHFNYEPSFAPAGKSVLQVIFTQYEQDYEYWDTLRKTDYAAYRQEKKRVAAHLQGLLEERFVELQGHLELLDTCTPATNTRFCNSHKGSYMCFALTPYNERICHTGRVQGLRNMWLAGQQLQAPGGLPNAVLTGKFAIQRLIKDTHH